jgi:hypothetical protein
VHLLPVYVFFFVALNFINETQWLMTGGEGTHYGVALIAVAAGIVAKVLLVVDHLRIVDMFPDEPLIWNVAWKTLLYSAAAALARLLERLVEDALRAGSFAGGVEELVNDTPWNVFAAVTLWYGALFTVYVAFREITVAVGTERIRELFFGR